MHNKTAIKNRKQQLKKEKSKANSRCFQQTLSHSPGNGIFLGKSKLSRKKKQTGDEITRREKSLLALIWGVFFGGFPEQRRPLEQNNKKERRYQRIEFLFIYLFTHIILLISWMNKIESRSGRHVARRSTTRRGLPSEFVDESWAMRSDQFLRFDWST